MPRLVALIIKPTVIQLPTADRIYTIPLPTCAFTISLIYYNLHPTRKASRIAIQLARGNVVSDHVQLLHQTFQCSVQRILRSVVIGQYDRIDPGPSDPSLMMVRLKGKECAIIIGIRFEGKNAGKSNS